MPNSRAVSRRLRPSTNVEPSDKGPRFSCSRPTSSNRDIGLPLATFYAARSGTAPPLLWPTFSPAHTQDGDELKSGQEVPRQLIVPCGNSPKVLEFAKEVLNEVAGFIQLPVILPRGFTATPRRNDDLDCGLLQRFDHAFLGVISLVCDHRSRLDVREENLRSGQIVDLGDTHK